MITTDIKIVQKEAEKMIKDVSNNINTNEEELSTKYKTLFSSSPTLFKLILKNGKNFDEEMLKNLLNKISNIQTNVSTQEKESEQVGQILFDKYIGPVVKK